MGHWGCNPGIAWVVGHLVAHWNSPDPFLLVVGTGHATSFVFVFAHDAIVRRADANEVTAATRRYGQPGGDPTESLDRDDVPYVGGELGPSLAVSQGLAFAGDTTVCVVGDGEVETPVALAALAHADVLLDGNSGLHPWLPVVNANGARMGAPARFRPSELQRMLRGFGYEVIVSSAEADEACEAARAALVASLAGTRVAWVSVTDKGWPAPTEFGGVRFIGHLAHKPTSIDLRRPKVVSELHAFLSELLGDDLLDDDGRMSADIVAAARCASLHVASQERHAASGRPDVPPSIPPAPSVWAQPVDGADEVLARRGTLVLSPDEAASNGLTAAVAAGCVREVLAEEVCIGWAWGLVEGGREVVFATYEAFGPKVSTSLAQYAKVLSARPRAGRPPLVVLQTSLGWANSPTHQNADLAATLLARPAAHGRLATPTGRSSMARRIEGALDDSDSVTVLVCSKQPLLDLPDPGSMAAVYANPGGGPARASVIAVGDVAVTEAVAVMAFAHARGESIQVVTLIDVLACRDAAASGGIAVDGPVVSVVWCPPAFLEPTLWRMAGGPHPVAGYGERYGATPWETLVANGMDRASLLHAVMGVGVPIDAADIDDYARRLQTEAAHAPRSVPCFACPSLEVRRLPKDE